MWMKLQPRESGGCRSTASPAATPPRNLRRFVSWRVASNERFSESMTPSDTSASMAPSVSSTRSQSAFNNRLARADSDCSRATDWLTSTTTAVRPVSVKMSTSR